MTEITKNPERKPRYSVNPTAFLLALIIAPLAVTAFSFWTVIGLFALPLGIIPYLVVGTPTLLWAVGRIKPNFTSYAALGFFGNLGLGIAGYLPIASGNLPHVNLEFFTFLIGFGFFFAPFYAGAFGSLYASFHPNIRILQT